jgi:hypothetical protein
VLLRMWIILFNLQLNLTLEVSLLVLYPGDLSIESGVMKTPNIIEYGPICSFMSNSGVSSL